MKFSEVEKHIHSIAELRIPQALNEMMWCKPLALYLNKKYGLAYDDVRKDTTLEDKGIDVILSSPIENEDELLVQLTHAREYDMSPDSPVDMIDSSGAPTINALTYKCDHYVKRGVETRKIILVIQGILNKEKVLPLLNKVEFLEPFQSTDCFDGIYYISDHVYPLKEFIPAIY